MKALMLALPVTVILVAVANKPAVAMPGDQLRASVTHSMRADGLDVTDLPRLTTSQLARLNTIFESDETPGNKHFVVRNYLKQIGR